MNCEKIRAILITDYIDGRLKVGLKNSIDHHLAHCQDCSVFLSAIKKEVVIPLNRIVHTDVSAYLWEAIKKSIQEKQEIEKPAVLVFWKYLLNSIYFPKPAFVLAGILTGFLMIGTTGQFIENMQNISLNNHIQAEYISSLIAYPTAVDSNGVPDQQTSIEKYFL